LKVAIDYTPAYEQGGGIGRYVRELIAALALVDGVSEYRLFVAGKDRSPLTSALPDFSDNFLWVTTRISPVWLARLWHRLLVPLPVQVFVGLVDLYHATDFVLPPLLGDVKSIVTVHDLSFVRVPGAASPSLKAYLDRVVPNSVLRASYVLVDSEATLRDVVDVYGIDLARLGVLYCGVSSYFVPSVLEMTIRSSYQMPERPYIFTVGTIQPRKNYARLVQALAILRSRNYDLSLVIAGGHGWLEDPIYETIRDAGMSDFVHFIGFARDDDLPALYSGAICVAFPSLYEGFGLPVLEGMACGTPVVTSNVSSLPEVAGDAALMVDPYDVEAIADAIQRVIDDEALRQTMIERGFAQARRFTWERSARQLLTIYSQVLSDTD
jgi:glycosyltransferase involved in cell wall biosynthesis